MTFNDWVSNACNLPAIIALGRPGRHQQLVEPTILQTILRAVESFYTYRGCSAFASVGTPKFTTRALWADSIAGAFRTVSPLFNPSDLARATRALSSLITSERDLKAFDQLEDNKAAVWLARILASSWIDESLAGHPGEVQEESLAPELCTCPVCSVRRATAVIGTSGPKFAQTLSATNGAVLLATVISLAIKEMSAEEAERKVDETIAGSPRKEYIDALVLALESIGESAAARLVRNRASLRVW